MASIEEVILVDGETKVAVKVLLTSEDADRARTDPDFATELLKMHTAACPESSQLHDVTGETESIDVQDVPSTVLGVDSPITDLPQEESLFRWPTEVVLLFLSVYEDHLHYFSSGKYSKKNVWSLISKEMENKGYKITPGQCTSKMLGLKRTYKSIKDHNSKSGNGRKDWPYFAVMDRLLGCKPEITPVATASSSGIETCATTSHSSTQSSLGSTSDEEETPRAGRKRGRMQSDMSDAIDLFRADRERHHQEKMKHRAEMFAELIAALKK